MGYMDLLKNAVASNDNERTIEADGRRYSFKPGKNGSLTTTGDGMGKPLVPSRDPIAKTLPAPKPIQDVATQTAAVRG